jgi:hypothetical protein
VLIVEKGQPARLYVGRARLNTMLQQERIMLQRAITARRCERDARKGVLYRRGR